MDYCCVKERDGWAVWTCSPHTGDRKDHISDHRTKRSALAAIERLHVARNTGATLVCAETAYGTTQRLSFSIKCF